MLLAHARAAVTHALRPRVACVTAVGITLAGASVPATASASPEPYRTPTIYVAATGGSTTGSGATPGAPVTFARAKTLAVPGSVVGMLPGTYNLVMFTWGKPGNVIERWGPEGSVVFRYAGAGASHIFGFGPDADNSEIRGVYLRGDPVGATSETQWATTGVHGSPGATHLTLRENRVWNTGAAGFGLHGGDYYTVVSNEIFHVGYDPNKGWSSGITLHQYVWGDTAPGFHNYVIGNRISGSTDARVHSDGNGIILDNRGRTNDTPWTLIANNVTWQNGAAGIAMTNTRRAWIVNNTAMHNTLDTSIGQGEIKAATVGDGDVRAVNNVAFAYTANPPFAFGSAAAPTTTLSRNVEWGGVASTALPAGAAGNPDMLRRVNPLLRNPLVSSDNGYGSAIAPWSIGDRLEPAAGSPLIGAGVDPRALPEATAELDAGMTKWLGTDVTGAPRVQNGTWDIGAYEVG